MVFEICQNGEVPPACIAEDGYEVPEWSPSDTIGGNPPGSGDGIPDPPNCDDDDPICEGTDPPELICPQSASFGQMAQCQLNLNGNAVAGTEWEVSGMEFSPRISGGEDIVQKFWGGVVVADFEVKVDIWLFDGGSSTNNVHWQRLESGPITVTRPAAAPWSPSSDLIVVENQGPCGNADEEPGATVDLLGLTYSSRMGCYSSEWISPDYSQTAGEGIVTDSVESGWQAGLHFVVSSSYYIALETTLNPHFTSGFAAAAHPVTEPDGYFTQLCPDGTFTFYELNMMGGETYFSGLPGDILTHERRHTTRVQERMDDPGYDPRVRVWRLVADSRQALLSAAEDEVGDVDGLLNAYSRALDGPTYEATPLWSGALWVWNPSGPGWMSVDPFLLAWDGGGAP